MAEGLVLEEQRRHSRRELIYYLKISDTKTGLELGRMGDIHTAGMLILSQAPLPVGATYHVGLELPKAMQSSARKEVFFQIEVLWSRPGPKNSTYKETGVRFLDSDRATEDLVNKLIDLFAMPGR